MFNLTDAARSLVGEMAAENEKLKKHLKEVTEAMVLLAALAGYENNKDVPWAMLAKEARQLYEETK